MNPMDTGIFPAPMHSSYMGRLAMCAAMVACHIWIYSFMGHRPATSRAYSTGGHSHPLYPAHQSVFPTIFMATRWWKTFRTASIAPFTTHISLPYSNNVWTNALYTGNYVGSYGNIKGRRRAPWSTVIITWVNLWLGGARAILMANGIVSRVGLHSIYTPLPWV